MKFPGYSGLKNVHVPVHSGRIIKAGGDKNGPTNKNDWNLGIF